jgi:pimeloyl-ACP methyl ester carboxylesterase
MVVLFGAMVAGLAYQRFAESRDLRRYPPPGDMVEVQGHRLHLYCLGQGAPTVVLEAGLSQASLAWTLVQPELARFTRVCAYDRAGNGWSDPGPTPRTPRLIVNELHILLHKSGNPGPFVLVGHSIGGMYTRVYASTYPKEVAGMVLVDSLPEQPLRWTPRGIVWEQDFQQLDLWAYSQPLQARLGLMRLRGMPAGLIRVLPPTVLAPATALGLRSHAYDYNLNEGAVIKETVEQVRAIRPLGDIPVFVLLAPNKLPTNRETWQARLSQLSRHVSYLLVEGSGHFIHLARPQIVVDAIRQTVEFARCIRVRESKRARAGYLRCAWHG